jgi:hypothetical protein
MWSVKTDTYAAPELGRNYLQGDVFGHPRHEDGKNVTTSRISKVKGRLVKTRSGSVYRLGRIKPEYRKFLKENGIEYNQHQPVRMI